ncbi:MAG: hypothetical protein V7703_08525 [Hyphomicrobiales bacterium]
MLTPRLRAFIGQNKLIVGIAAASFFALVYFAGSFVAKLIYFNDPSHQNEALQAWMTPYYVALSYDLPRDTIKEIFEFTDGFDGPKRMSFVAERLDVSLEELTEKVREAAQAYHGQAND